MAIIFPARSGIQNFLVAGEPLFFHCIILFCFGIPLMDRSFTTCNDSWKKFLWICFIEFKILPRKFNTALLLYWGVSILGTEKEMAFSMPRLLWRIAKTGSSDTLHSQAIVDTLKCLFCKDRSLTSGTLLKQSFLPVFQCRGHCQWILYASWTV